MCVLIDGTALLRQVVDGLKAVYTDLCLVLVCELQTPTLPRWQELEGKHLSYSTAAEACFIS